MCSAQLARPRTTSHTHTHTQHPPPQDGHKQDALDLISGAYTVKRDVKLRFRRQVGPAIGGGGRLAERLRGCVSVG